MQGQPHQPNRIQGLIPGVLELSSEGRLLHLEIDAHKHPFSPVFIGNGVFFHIEVLQNHLFAVPLHHQIMHIRRMQRQYHGKIRLDIDPLSIHAENAVAHLQTLFSADGAVVLHTVDHRLGQSADRQTYQNHQDHTHEEVHGSARHQNEKPLPPRRLVEGMGIVTVSVLPFHGAEAADGNGADGIQGLPHLFLPDGRPHKQGKLIDLHP